MSLGIVLDTSGSMAGEKIANALAAIERFLDQLLDPHDEVFLYRFPSDVDLDPGVDDDRDGGDRSLRRVRAAGGTAMYDAVVEAVPMAQAGATAREGDPSHFGWQRYQQPRHRPGRPPSRARDRSAGLRDRHRRRGNRRSSRGHRRFRGRRFPNPFPIPGGRPHAPAGPPPGSPATSASRPGDSLNVAALRAMTDVSGGRTEIVRDARDLDRATSSIADELSKQYYLGYSSPGHRDGRWHTIRVEVRDRRCASGRAAGIRDVLGLRRRRSQVRLSEAATLQHRASQHHERD